jgi:hypothetical protein
VAQDGGLDAEVVGHDPLRGPTLGAGEGHGVRIGARHRTDEIDAVGAGLGGGGGLDGRLVGGAERPRHGAGVADVAGEAAGVDAGDAGHVRGPQEAVEVAVGSPVAAAPSQVAHDDAAGEGSAALVVESGDAVVADVGVGERDDLPGVGRIGDDLLVAGEGGVEHDLPRSHPAGGLGADGLALEGGAVGQHQQGLADGAHRCASPSSTVGWPWRIVWRTSPRTVRPA